MQQHGQGSGGGLNDFITKWNTTLTSTGSSASNQVKLPFSTSSNYTVYWGDGSSELVTNADPAPTHTYSVAGIYTITCKGTVAIDWSASGSVDRAKFLEVNQWGNNLIFSSQVSNQFSLCLNIEFPALDVPNLAGAIMREAFRGCRFTTIPNINSWDFTVAASNVTGLFRENTNFNQPLSIDFSAQTNFSFMILSCSSFASSLVGCDFTSGIHFNSFLRNCDSYNLPFTGVQFGSVSSLTNYKQMLRDCLIFNQPLTAASFPRPQDVGNMLVLTGAYNSTISFNWSEVTNANGFLNLNNNAFSTANYDALLLHINSFTLQTGVTLSVNAFYTAGSASATARANIIATYGWTISDKGAI